MTNTRLLVLGILKEKPRHGYEIKKWLEERKTGLWADVLHGSIYAALKTLAAQGMLQERSAERTGNRLRAVYAITPSGKREFQRLLRKTWQDLPSPFPTSIYAATAFIDQLPPDELSKLVSELVEKLEERALAWSEGEATKGKLGYLTEIVRAIFADGRAHLETDVRFLRKIAELLSEERSSWSRK